MSKIRIFIDRRRRNRRQDPDPCEGLPVDLYHRKRRKSPERRQQRTLAEDYLAFQSSQLEAELEAPTSEAEAD